MYGTGSKRLTVLYHYTDNHRPHAEFPAVAKHQKFRSEMTKERERREWGRRD